MTRIQICLGTCAHQPCSNEILVCPFQNNCPKLLLLTKNKKKKKKWKHEEGCIHTVYTENQSHVHVIKLKKMLRCHWLNFSYICIIKTKQNFSYSHVETQIPRNHWYLITLKVAFRQLVFHWQNHLQMPLQPL